MVWSKTNWDRVYKGTVGRHAYRLSLSLSDCPFRLSSAWCRVLSGSYIAHPCPPSPYPLYVIGCNIILSERAHVHSNSRVAALTATGHATRNIFSLYYRSSFPLLFTSGTWQKNVTLPLSRTLYIYTKTNFFFWNYMKNKNKYEKKLARIVNSHLL